MSLRSTAMATKVNSPHEETKKKKNKTVKDPALRKKSSFLIQPT